MYKRILLAYDGSREGLIALREGALLAKRDGAEAFLLSVVPEAGALIAQSVGGDPLGHQVDTHQLVLARGLSVLDQLGVASSGKLISGDPAAAIVAHAREVAADLIVLGHRHHGALARWFTESTSDYVSEHVPCSVLLGSNPISDETFAAALLASANAPPAPAAQI